MGSDPHSPDCSARRYSVSLAITSVWVPWQSESLRSPTAFPKVTLLRSIRLVPTAQCLQKLHFPFRPLLLFGRNPNRCLVRGRFRAWIIFGLVSLTFAEEPANRLLPLLDLPRLRLFLFHGPFDEIARRLMSHFGASAPEKIQKPAYRDIERVSLLFGQPEGR